MKQKNLVTGILLAGSIFAFFSCQQSSQTNIEKTAFGTLPDGQNVDLYTLHNANGMTVKITNFGGAITSWTAPDKSGVYDDIVLGCDSLAGYLRGTPFFGALIGRYGNRIAKGKFTLDNTTYDLAINNIGNHLHGGIKGFDKVLWTATAVGGESPALKLHYLSKDGEEGYPGNLSVDVVYTLQKDNALSIEYTATSDKPTVVNLTNHSYFNLANGGEGDILEHDLMLAANTYLPVDSTLIPTGEVRPVAGTVFDFTQPEKIGARINDSTDVQIRYGLGYDHCWVRSNKTPSDQPVKIAMLYEMNSGRVMEVLTTEPAVQFYSGNFLDGKVIGKDDVTYERRSGLCLETQHFPDSPNQPAFPSTVLRPGGTYKSTTIYRFTVQK